MNGCEKSGGSGATRIGFPDSCRLPRCMVCSVIPGCDWCRCGVGKKSLWAVWNNVAHLLRSPSVRGPRSALRSPAGLLGIGAAAGGLPEVRQSEARTFALAGGQSVLHQTVRFLRGAAVPRHDDQGGGRGTGFGLEDGKGAGQAIHAGAVEARGAPRPAGHWHRRGVDPQGAHLPDRGERFAAPPADSASGAKTVRKPAWRNSIAGWGQRNAVGFVWR